MTKKTAERVGELMRERLRLGNELNRFVTERHRLREVWLHGNTEKGDGYLLDKDVFPTDPILKSYEESIYLRMREIDAEIEKL